MKFSIPDEFTFVILVQPVLTSNSLIIANPDISLIESILIFMNLCSLGFRSTSVIGKKGMDLFGNVSMNP